MRKSGKTAKKVDSKPMIVQAKEGEGETASMARVMVDPYLRHGVVVSDLAQKLAGELPGKPRFDDYSKIIKSKAGEVLQGDMTLASELLTAHALSLDAMMTELMRRATMNLGDYPLAAERYARLAFKAQSNSRATIEALVKLHQPRVQTVRHVHVNEGGQAVVADHFHNHTRGKENGKITEQPHAAGTAGTSSALSGADPLGQAVPIASGQGEAAVQDARRKSQRRT